MKAAPSRRIGILHYSAPPVIGGVESVMLAHARLFRRAGYPTTILAGRGEQGSLPPGAQLISIPELDSQHPEILELSRELERGHLPDTFEPLTGRIAGLLAPHLQSIDLLIVHNVFTKHFNLPLTTALVRLLDRGAIRRGVAWCHDITWTSPRSRSKLHPGYPWELLRMYRPDLTYVTISQERQRELAEALECLPGQIQVIYNGVEPVELLALSEAGLALIDRLELWDSDLNVLLPVRVTRAKNIELAIRVIAALAENDLDVKLVITGPPDPHDPASMEYYRTLLQLREELGVNRQVRFVYESGSLCGDPCIVDMPLVAALFRVSDALFLPSHSEGFGMPVLEAGLVGMPVFCSDRVPAGNELGAPDITRFSPDAAPGEVAGLILRRIQTSPVLNLRRRVRQEMTWRSLFRHEILPLVEQRSF